MIAFFLLSLPPPSSFTFLPSSYTCSFGGSFLNGKTALISLFFLVWRRLAKYTSG
ncbi:hypothetical protein BDQ94DRAFT_4064 [Aspergillus welwitschiae]|uniref:Uncharacterized protein n=1 Tax=Aspergillus welwitschiae TaxID=1341132 RepID=A0A3F3QJ30_9EURO|nr:hypothetical protein BDQ94DRAFT_4064 [Aspergillus welwitschiae]RDH39278.1 hypothetical protein BDQ94DRAFT_4064 [Aspergillus welwitschiae]